MPLACENNFINRALTHGEICSGATAGAGQRISRALPSGSVKWIDSPWPITKGPLKSTFLFLSSWWVRFGGPWAKRYRRINMKPKKLLTNSIETHLLDEFTELGFKYLNSKQSFKRTEGQFVQEIVFCSNRYNHENECEFWTMWNVSSKSYSKWRAFVPHLHH